jgi:cytochrome c-type biogenesis protein
MSLSGFVQHFWLGVLTPLSAVCVIPLYPAFIAFLTSTEDGETSRSPVVLGVLVVAGVVAFMALVGVVYTLVLAEAVNSAVETFSPIAFWILVAIGLVLLVNPALFSRLSTVEPPQSTYPSASAFSYGFFFGAIAIPCNPGLIAVFFSTTPILYDTQLASMIGFLSFGFGMGAPLLAFAVLAESVGGQLTRGLARHSTLVYRGTGVILIGVSAYYLLFVLPAIPPVVSGLLPG